MWYSNYAGAYAKIATVMPFVNTKFCWLTHASNPTGMYSLFVYGTFKSQWGQQGQCLGKERSARRRVANQRVPKK